MNEFAGLEVEPGTRVRGNIRVGPYFYHKRAHVRRYVRIPFTVIRGTEDGPTLCVTAGTHPTEYAGIDAAIRLTNEVRPDDLKGTLIVVPLVNPPGFWERNYINPIDGGNIQGNWPGKTGGTISELMAYRIWNELVSKADYYLDYHGGDIPESEVGFSVFYKTGDERLDRKSEEMAKALGYEYIFSFDGEGNKGYSFANAPLHGIPSAEAEHCSGGVLLPEESSEIFEGTLNVMRYLKMLEGEPRKMEGQKLLTSRVSVFFDNGGLYYSNVKPGELVEEGQVVGILKNLKGEVIETIRAPVRGYPLLMIHNPVKLPGDPAITLYHA
jgi:predicted deacylase